MKKRVRKNYTLKPSSVKVLERLARDLDMSMSRVLEAAIDALREKRSKIRTLDIETHAAPNLDKPRTWEEAERLLASLPNKSDLEKEK